MWVRGITPTGTQATGAPDTMAIATTVGDGAIDLATGTADRCMADRRMDTSTMTFIAVVIMAAKIPDSTAAVMGDTGKQS